MTATAVQKREVSAEDAEVPVFGDSPCPDDATITHYYRIYCESPPKQFLGKPVVRKLPADWPYPSEKGYDD